MTDEELKKIAEAADARCPQPWTVMPDSSSLDSAWIMEIGTGYDGEMPREVIEFACAANPLKVLELLARLERYRTALDRISRRDVDQEIAEEGDEYHAMAAVAGAALRDP